MAICINMKSSNHTQSNFSIFLQYLFLYIMASFKNSFACLVLMALLGVARSDQISFGEKIDSSWYDAHATFYGDIKGGQTMSTCVCVCVYFFHIKYYLFILCGFLLVKTTDMYIDFLMCWLYIGSGSLWLWRSLQTRVWTSNSSLKHSTLQQWTNLWCLLWTQVCEWSTMVQKPCWHHQNHSNQFMPSQLRSFQCLVQPTTATFWSIDAHVSNDRRI